MALTIRWLPAGSEEEADEQYVLEEQLARGGLTDALLERIKRRGGIVAEREEEDPPRGIVFDGVRLNVQENYSARCSPSMRWMVVWGVNGTCYARCPTQRDAERVRDMLVAVQRAVVRP